LSQPVRPKNKVKLREYFAQQHNAHQGVYNNPSASCVWMYPSTVCFSIRTQRGKYRQGYGKHNYAVKTPLIVYCNIRLNNRRMLLLSFFKLNLFQFLFELFLLSISILYFSRKHKGFPLLSGLACFCILIYKWFYNHLFYK
jgi:hypothetical protein